MIVTETQSNEELTALGADAVQIIQDQRMQEDAARQQNLQDRKEFVYLSRRNAQLAHSLTANDQRERALLQIPLMKLYAALNPKSIYKWDNDYDIVMRVDRRPHSQ